MRLQFLQRCKYLTKQPYHIKRVMISWIMAKSISMFWLRTSSQEMKLVKYDLLTWKLPQTVRDGKLSRTEWVMQQRFSYQGHFPLMIFVVGALLFIPVSNARPKRGASKVKLIKNCLRSLLKGDMLNSLMHISLNGPSVTSEEGQQVIKDSVVPGWLLKIARNFHLFPLPLVLPTTKVSRTQYLHTGYSSSGWRARRATASG